MAAGALVAARGSALGPGEIATLLSVGVRRAPVFPLPRIAVLSTGDELLDASDGSLAGSGAASDSGGGGIPGGGAVDTNRPLLMSLLQREVGYAAPQRLAPGSSVEPVLLSGGCLFDAGICGDDRAALKQRLRAAAAVADVVVTTGGVSMGDRDHVKPLLEEWVREGEGDGAGGGAAGGLLAPLLPRLLFGRLNMKPGKPATCALVRAPASAGTRPVLVFALPGNPVSAWVCAQMLLLPVLRHLRSGGTLPWPRCLPPAAQACVLDGHVTDPERPEFVRATVWAAPLAASTPAAAPSGPPQPQWGLYARLTAGSQASSRIASVASANALLWLPAGGGAAQPPFAAQAYLLGPLPHEAALPAELRDTRTLRRIAPSAAASAAAAATASAAASAGAGHGRGDGGGCRCGMDHGAAAFEVTTSAAAATAPAPAAPVAAAAPAKVHPPHALAPRSRLRVRACIMTVSDRCAAGEAEDKSGPAIAALLARLYPEGDDAAVSSLAVTVTSRVTVPDDRERIRAAAAAALAGDGSSDGGSEVAPSWPQLLISTGGTGLGARDCTPEALRPLITRPCHGLQHALLAASLAHTPMAALSRYEAGIVDHEDCVPVARAVGDAADARGVHPPSNLHGRRTLLLELPGSVKAVTECLEALARVLPHALALVCEE